MGGDPTHRKKLIQKVRLDEASLIHLEKKRSNQEPFSYTEERGRGRSKSGNCVVIQAGDLSVRGSPRGGVGGV